MEVWLESLLMHLSVGMPLPPDLLFDISNFRGISPSSSGSTTPEGIPSGHRSPALEPIREGKMIDTTNSKKAKSNSTESLKVASETKKGNGFVKPIIKVSSSEDLDEIDKKKNCEVASKSGDSPTAVTDKFPNYENINFLRNDSDFNESKEKPICIQKVQPELHKDSDERLNSKMTEIPDKDSIFKVQLRRVPKNFTRNKFSPCSLESTSKGPIKDKIKLLSKKSIPETPKRSNLSLQSMNLNSNMISKVTEKYMEDSACGNVDINPLKPIKNLDIPDIVSSTIRRSFNPNVKDKKNKSIPDNKPDPELKRTTIFPSGLGGTFSINRNIFRRNDHQKNSREDETGNKVKSKVEEKDRPRLRLFDEAVCDIYEPSGSLTSGTSIVKSIVDSLNRKEKGSSNLGERLSYGRSSLKVPSRSKHRYGNSDEYMAL